MAFGACFGIYMVLWKLLFGEGRLQKVDNNFTL